VNSGNSASPSADARWTGAPRSDATPVQRQADVMELEVPLDTRLGRPRIDGLDRGEVAPSASMSGGPLAGGRERSSQAWMPRCVAYVGSDFDDARKRASTEVVERSSSGPGTRAAAAW
jgi:hypothetical protein